jgi:pantothenate kinase-related protein Tda10
MTELLQKAFAEAARLPEDKQDIVARTLLEDLVKFVPNSIERKRPQFGSAKGSVPDVERL